MSSGDPEERALEEAIAAHPAGKRLTPRERALFEAAKWAKRVDIAREEYGRALDECRKLGIPNTVIARRVGKSEGAVRMHFWRRRGSNE